MSEYQSIQSRSGYADQLTSYDIAEEKGADSDKGVVTRVGAKGREAYVFRKTQNGSVAGDWTFHVLNFLTGGIFGAVGSLCAQSQAMGSQKSSLIKGMGHLYNSATHLSKNDGFWRKGLKTAATVFSFPAHVLLSPARLLQNALGPDMCRYRSMRSREFGKSQWRMFNSVRGFDHVVGAGQIYRDLWNEINSDSAMQTAEAGDKQDYINPWQRRAFSSGSTSLKKAASLHAQKDYCQESVEFLNWSGSVLDKADPESLNYDSRYRFSKRELLDLHDNFVKRKSPHEINISSNNRKQLVKTLNPPGNNGGMAGYKQRFESAQAELTASAQELQTAQAELARIAPSGFKTLPTALNSPLHSDERGTQTIHELNSKVQRYVLQSREFQNARNRVNQATIRSETARTRFDEVCNEKLTTQQTREIAPLIAAADHSVYAMMKKGTALQNLREEIQSKAGVE